ncbi:MAG TPA: DUF853 family protein, partial [Vitreoscilla sp.]|nr:DUF853 family protein [Vitreoscilla sp.]
DQKAVKAAAETFRSNPDVDVVTTIAELGTGEALVSFLDEKGMPTPVERAWILPPSSLLSPLQADVLTNKVQSDDLYATYKDAVDAYSAYEAILDFEKQQTATAEATEAATVTKTEATSAKEAEDPGLLDGLLTGLFGGRRKNNANISNKIGAQVGHTISNKLTKSISDSITRTILGVIKGK